MPLWVVLLCLLCAVLLFRLFTLEKDLRAATRQLKERRATHSGASVTLAAPNAAAEELLAEINALLRQREDERAGFRAREQALRRQIANVSHDLRTPLTSILGYLQLLEDPDLDPQRRREYLDIVSSRAKALQELITGFYDLSRIEAGEYPIARERVDLAETIRAQLAAFYGELEGRFTVEVDLPPHLPEVWGDAGAVSRVYANLFRNALDHGGGTLRLTAWQEGGEVVTRVQSGGAQLRPEDLPHVFDRFFTADPTRSGANTGLGLTIVQLLCRQMGAQARAELEGEDFSVILNWEKA